jgi:acyl-CoA thioester hydrolase
MTDLPVYRATLEADWIDYNGHLRDAYYGLVASYAVDAVMDHLGLDAAYRQRTHCTLYTLETHLHYLHEVKFSDELHVTSSVLDFDGKRMHLGCVFACARRGGPRVDQLVATAEMMLLHVHQGDKPASAPLPSATMATLSELKTSAAALAPFAPGSRKIELKRR